MVKLTFNNTDAMREAFEEWFGSQGMWHPIPGKKDKKANGEYEDYLAEREWKKWQKKHTTTVSIISSGTGYTGKPALSKIWAMKLGIWDEQYEADMLKNYPEIYNG